MADLSKPSRLTIEALELAATFGRFVRIDEYEEATRRLNIESATVLRDLFRYRLANLDDEIGGYRFRHPSVVQALLDSAQHNQRTEKLNRICAAVLTDLDEEEAKDRLGLHLIRSGSIEQGLLKQMEFINRFGDTFTRSEIDRRFVKIHQQLTDLQLPENHYLWQK